MVAASVRSQLAYPTSFALQCVAQALVQLEDMVIILVLFSRISEMGGFTRREVLLIYSLAGISFGLADMLVGSLDKVGQLVRDRKSTRLNSSHANISYAVFCLKKKTQPPHRSTPCQTPYTS